MIAFVNTNLITCGGIITNFEYVKELKLQGFEADIFAEEGNNELENFYQIRIRRLSELNLTDNDILILNKRRSRVTTTLMMILYFSAIVFIFNISAQSMMTVIDYGMRIKPFTIFQTSLIFLFISFIKNLFFYVGFLFLGLAIHYVYEKLINKNRYKEKKLMEKLKNG